MSEENFKIIPGFSKYEISKTGIVRMVNNKLIKSVRLSKRKRSGYYEMSMVRDDGSKTTQYLHRLIALTYLPNPEDLPCVNHINEIKTDNRIKNLEWCSYSYNNTHNGLAIRVARKRKKEGSYVGLNKRKCVKFTTDGKLIRTYESVLQANRLNFGDVPKNLSGTSKTCGGYVYEYID